MKMVNGKFSKQLSGSGTSLGDTDDIMALGGMSAAKKKGCITKGNKLKKACKGALVIRRRKGGSRGACPADKISYKTDAKGHTFCTCPGKKRGRVKCPGSGSQMSLKFDEKKFDPNYSLPDLNGLGYFSKRRRRIF